MARGDSFFFQPTQTVYDRPEEHGLVYEPVHFAASDGIRLHGWLFPAQTADRPARGTVVHCHGNAGNITGHYRFVEWLPARGWNVLCFDYRGFGQSQGRCTREAALADIHAAIDFAKSSDQTPANAVVLFGQSIGGTLAVVAASQRNDLTALVIEGAFSSFRQEAGHVCRHTWWLWGISWLVPRVFIAPGCDAIEAAPRLGTFPKLFAYGGRDQIVEPGQTIALHDAAPDPKELLVMEEGRHTEAFVQTDRISPEDVARRRDHLCAFLEAAASHKVHA